MKRLSVVIITWNGRQLLDSCLRSLAFAADAPDCEVIVVDNGSTDGTADMLRAEYPWVRLRRLSRNFGVAYARNRGLEMASGEYLLLLDNDTVANREAIEGLCGYMERHPDCGLCACRLIDRWGHLQPSCKRYPGIGEKLKSLAHRRGYRFAYQQQVAGQEFEPDYVIGACQMFRRDVYASVGALDERIFYGPEDADFCLRVRAAGWRVRYVPQFAIVHYCQRATATLKPTALTRKHVRGLLYFYAKHRRWF